MSRMVPQPEPGNVCTGREQDLLMYAHDALTPFARVRVGRHLRRCPACQQRLASLTAASQALADAVRGPVLPRWSPPAAPGGLVWYPASLLSVLLSILAVVSLIGAGMLVSHVQANPGTLAFMSTRRCPLSSMTPRSDTDVVAPGGITLKAIKSRAYCAGPPALLAGKRTAVSQ